MNSKYSQKLIKMELKLLKAWTVNTVKNLLIVLKKYTTDAIKTAS